jgi:hypothetical protein
MTPQIGKHLHRHSRAHPAGIDELAVIGVVPQKQRPEMRSRALRIGPADDDELLAVEPFGLAPKAAVSWRIGRVDRLGDRAVKTELARVLEDKPAVAGLMAVEQEAGLTRD